MIGPSFHLGPSVLAFAFFIRGCKLRPIERHERARPCPVPTCGMEGEVRSRIKRRRSAPVPHPAQCLHLISSVAFAAHFRSTALFLEFVFSFCPNPTNTQCEAIAVRCAENPTDIDEFFACRRAMAMLEGMVTSPSMTMSAITSVESPFSGERLTAAAGSNAPSDPARPPPATRTPHAHMPRCVFVAAQSYGPRTNGSPFAASAAPR